MQRTMQSDCAVFRTGETLADGKRKLARRLRGPSPTCGHRPLADLELRPDRDAGARQPDRPGGGDDAFGGEPHRKPRRPRARGFPRSRRPELDEAHAVLGRRRGGTTIDYRPVHLNTLTDDVESYSAQGAHLLRRFSRSDRWLNFRSRQFQGPQGRAVFKAPAGAKNVRVFKIYRYDPDSTENPRLDTYEVDMDELRADGLDALIKIKNEIDSTLTFRRSCREGICGSCAMNIDGTKRLACISACADVKGDVKIYPLPHMPVIKDLVPDLTNFYAQYASIKPWLQTRTPPPPDASGCNRRGSGKGRRPSECILCACCSTSCPSYWWNSDRYLGPAALLAGLPLDRRQPRRGDRRAARQARGSVPAVSLPHDHELHRGLPEGPESGQGDRRDQAAAGPAGEA
jgi:succinate dehydrogenase / fumarate reductase, iron-sulfur subunit